ncbi:hypothetical protein MKX01_000638 [Papaver californicum]|nr:hypothetical protein MKX01_000638 [Papaver californicum]
MRPEFSKETTRFTNAQIDWKGTPEAHVFKEEKNNQWHRVEHSSGKFLRRFRLPDNAGIDQVKATMENGVLIVTIPKVEMKKPQVKTIEISG